VAVSFQQLPNVLVSFLLVLMKKFGSHLVERKENTPLFMSSTMALVCMARLLPIFKSKLFPLVSLQIVAVFFHLIFQFLCFLA
jgi:hypothetical protein